MLIEQPNIMGNTVRLLWGASLGPLLLSVHGTGLQAILLATVHSVCSGVLRISNSHHRKTVVESPFGPGPCPFLADDWALAASGS